MVIIFVILILSCVNLFIITWKHVLTSSRIDFHLIDNWSLILIQGRVANLNASSDPLCFSNLLFFINMYRRTWLSEINRTWSRFWISTYRGGPITQAPHLTPSTWTTRSYPAELTLFALHSLINWFGTNDTTIATGAAKK